MWSSFNITFHAFSLLLLLLIFMDRPILNDLVLQLELHKELEDQENVVEFDFLGKDSIRYQNRVPVEKRVSLKFLFESFIPSF